MNNEILYNLKKSLQAWLQNNNLKNLPSFFKKRKNELEILKEKVKKEYNIKTDSISELCYILLKSPPKICEKGNKPTYISFTKGYSNFCERSKKCQCYQENKKKIMLNWWNSLTEQEKNMIQNKTKNTLLSFYGVTNPSKLDSVKKKIKETTMKNHGVDSVLKTKEVREKTLKNHYYSKKIDQETFNKINSRDWLYEEHIIKKKSCVLIANQLNVSSSLIHKRLKKFNIEAKTWQNTLLQEEVCSFIESLLKSKALINQKFYDENGMFEIDIFFPERNLGIEVNGLFWHTEDKVGKLYHFTKTYKSYKKGINLITIFSDSWEYSKQSIKQDLEYFLKDELSFLLEKSKKENGFIMVDMCWGMGNILKKDGYFFWYFEYPQSYCLNKNNKKRVDFCNCSEKQHLNSNVITSNKLVWDCGRAVYSK